MSEIEKLGVGLTANLAQFKRDLDAGSRLVDEWARTMESRSLAIRGPEVSGGGSSGPDAGAAADIGQQIESGLASAAGPITAFLNRFNSDFNRVGATVIELAKRIDGEFKFPKTQENFDKLRRVVTTNLVDSEGQVTRFGQALDRMLGVGKRVHAFADQFASMGAVVRTSISGIRPERISFASPIKSLGGLRVAADQATGAFRSLGVQIAVSLGAFGLVYKGVQFLKDGVKGATDLGETLSKTDAILKDSSAGVKRFADEMASKFGLVRQETLDTASSIGGLGKGLGQLGGKDLEDFTKKYTKLAIDLQSFANTSSLREAGQALTIGLSGEQSDTLKRLGVVLNEDTTKAYAFANGIAKYGQELTNQQKVMARAGLISKGLADANGDLEKTADSAANQYRKLQGNLDNLSTSLGGQLLPYLNEAVKGLNSFIAEMGAFDTGGNQLKGTLDGMVEGLASVADGAKAVGFGFRYAQAMIADAVGQQIQSLDMLKGALFSLIPTAGIFRDTLGLDFEAIGADMRRQAGIISDETAKAEAKLGDLGARIRSRFADVRPATGGSGGAANLTTVDDPAARAGRSVASLTEKLKDQFAAFGLTARAAELYKLKLDGATDAQLAQASALSKMLDAMDKFEDLKDFAKSTKADVQSPISAAMAQINRIDEAAKAGLLTKLEALKAKGNALRESGIGAAPKFAAAVDANSVEGRSAVLQATSARTFNGIRDVARGIQELIGLQREANNQNARMLAGINGDGAIAFPLR